ncbi:MAG: hypothetical protein EAZ63_07440 [Runella slithyformis]|nr:MAG: hypothetical protein EAZ63_07440 [Runella slithyformis]
MKKNSLTPYLWGLFLEKRSRNFEGTNKYGICDSYQKLKLTLEMKNFILLCLSLLLAIALPSCKKNTIEAEEDPKTAPLKLRKFESEWIAAEGGSGGFNNFESFKNLQLTFDVGEDNQAVEIAVASTVIDVQYALFDPLGRRIEASRQGRSLSKTYTLNAGQYRLVICAARGAVGKFEFIIQGVLKDPELIDSELLQSGSQNWGTLGGGGRDKSFKNHFYTFEVTDDNTSIDVALESAETDVHLMLYDNLGQPQLVSDFSNVRSRFVIAGAKKGTYTLMAATRTRGSVGNYQVNIVGKVSNLKKLDSQTNTVTGRWANKDAVDTYSLRVSSTGNSPVDLELSSGDTNVRLELQNGSGNFIERQIGNRTEFIVTKDLAPGTYRVQVKPYGNGFGNYTLHVHGQFADFKKL